MCWPTFSPPSSSGLVMQVEERRPRYPGEPRNKRLKFVSERQRSSDEWYLVRSSRGGRRSEQGSHGSHEHHPSLPQYPPFQQGPYGQHPVQWPQGPPQHQYHQPQMGYPQHAQIQHHPTPHQHQHQHQHPENHPMIQVMNPNAEFIEEEDGHHNGQHRLVERAPMPQNMQARYRGGGPARSPSHGQHGHHDRHRDSSSSSDEESYISRRRRTRRVLPIEDDDSFDDLRPPVRRWRRRSSSHRSSSRRRR